MTFSDLGLSESLLKALNDCGYKEPTPIQAQAIPPILMTRDVIGLAQTGTGKTGSFILPMIEVLHGGRAKARMPRSLVLSPTRELAAQIADNFETYGKYTPLSMALLTGGSAMGEQMKKLDRGVDVLIATPGRLLDLFERGAILLNDIKIFVIDEADRMLDMGFIPDIERIVSLLPQMRQTLLFSATMPPPIQKLTSKFLSNPKTIEIAARSSAAETVTQKLIWVDRRGKQQALSDAIVAHNVKNAFIFCNRKSEADKLAKYLKKGDLPAAPLHGDMAQSERTKTLAAFKAGEVSLLVCSDVAARGIDIEDVSHVFNYDIPFNAEDYVHRIGRTGRAGRVGAAISLAVKGDDEKLVAAIEQMLDKSLPVEEGAQPPAREKQSERSDRGSNDRQKSQPRQKPANQKSSQQKSENKRQGGKHHSSSYKQEDSDEGDSFGDDNMPAFLRR